jgi:hypothetical protein
MHQAFVKRNSALHKSEFADAALQNALLKKKLCHFRARHAKHVLDAANVYMDRVRSSILQGKRRSDLWKNAYKITTVTKPGTHRVQRMQLFLWNEHD